MLKSSFLKPISIISLFYLSFAVLSLALKSPNDENYVAYNPDKFTDINSKIDFIFSNTYPSFSLACFLAACCFKTKNKTMFTIAVFNCFIVCLVCFLNSNRMQAAFVLIGAMLIYHFKIQRIKIRQLLVLYLVFLLLEWGRTLREIPGGFFLITWKQLLHSFSVFQTSEIYFGPFVAFGGWDVVSNIFYLVPKESSYLLGKSYLQSIVGLLFPRSLGLGAFAATTPSEWYQMVYAPTVISHGFDFSMIAEAYLNFGKYGAIVFLIVGICLRLLDFAFLFSKDLWLQIFSLLGILQMTFSIRSDSNVLFKSLFFIAIPVSLIFFYVIKKYKKSGCAA